MTCRPSSAPRRDAAHRLAATLLLSAALSVAGCAREAFVPGCDDATSSPAAADVIDTIGWSGQDLLDRVTGTFVHPGEWQEGGSTEVTLTTAPGAASLTLHTLTQQTPPPGALVAEIAALCFDYLSVDVDVVLVTDDGALDETLTATATVTGDDGNPDTRYAGMNGELDPDNLGGTYVITELDVSEWDEVGLRLGVDFLPDATVQGAFGVEAERVEGDVAEATYGQVLTWGPE